MRQEIHQFARMGCRQSGAMLMAGLAVIFMVIMAAAPAPIQAASKVAEIMLSDRADANGVVAQHQSKFTPSVAEIYGTALIAGAEKAQEVQREGYEATGKDLSRFCVSYYFLWLKNVLWLGEEFLYN